MYKYGRFKKEILSSLISGNHGMYMPGYDCILHVCRGGGGGCQNLGGEYVTRIYLYSLCCYGVIVKVEGASAPSAPLAQPPLV